VKVRFQTGTCAPSQGKFDASRDGGLPNTVFARGSFDPGSGKLTIIFNFAGLQVVVHVEGDVAGYKSPGQFDGLEAHLPRAPRIWEPWTETIPLFQPQPHFMPHVPSVPYVPGRARRSRTAVAAPSNSFPSTFALTKSAS